MLMYSTTGKVIESFVKYILSTQPGRTTIQRMVEKFCIGSVLRKRELHKNLFFADEVVYIKEE